MGKFNVRISALAGIFALNACYHQVVATGLPASETKVDKPWTATWIFGLVPATPIDVRSQCTNGVAYVDTQTTFLNGLVSGLTLGIFTPRAVSITCASRSTANGASQLDVATNDAAALGAVLARAQEMSQALGHGVYVIFPESLGDVVGASKGGTK
ncbi:MAG: hypothetical protein ABI877_09375 [Gemmatimonadaceae bacterium]